MCPILGHPDAFTHTDTWIDLTPLACAGFTVPLTSTVFLFIYPWPFSCPAHEHWNGIVFGLVRATFFLSLLQSQACVWTPDLFSAHTQRGQLADRWIWQRYIRLEGQTPTINAVMAASYKYLHIAFSVFKSNVTVHENNANFHSKAQQGKASWLRFPSVSVLFPELSSSVWSQGLLRNLLFQCFLVVCLSV